MGVMSLTDGSALLFPTRIPCWQLKYEDQLPKGIDYLLWVHPKVEVVLGGNSGVALISCGVLSQSATLGSLTSGGA